ncbi:MAG TPA: ATP-binding protein [Puia sp.]|nr:ATP-binding protein [Puia sp.]
MSEFLPFPSFHNDFYKNILESLEDYGVFTTDIEGIVTSWNKGAEHVMGYTEEEICGKTAKVIFTDEDCKNGVPEHEFAEAMEKGRGLDERYHQRKDGSLFWASGLIFPLYDAEGLHIGFTKILRNLSNRKEAETELLEARRYAQSIVETSKEPILILNIDLTINSASKAFFKLFSLVKQEVENKNLFSILTDQFDPLPLQEQMQKYDSFENFELDYTDKLRQDDHILLVSSRKVFRTFKSVGQILLTFEDVTFQRKMEQAREDFISIASHELKTPISVIKAYAQILGMELESTASERVTQTLDRILIQSERLTKLTSFLLDVSAFKTGTIQLRKEPFVLLELMLEIVNELKQSNSKHQLILDEVTDASVLADRFRIGQVITNLLSNAIKYSPDEEKILINISVDKTKKWVRTSVQDHGIGVPPEYQPDLFRRFFRTDNIKATKIEGFGMGLYISSEIIKAHGGQMGVNSSGANGSTFFFELPLI